MAVAQEMLSALVLGWWRDDGDAGWNVSPTGLDTSDAALREPGFSRAEFTRLGDPMIRVQSFLCLGLRCSLSVNAMPVSSGMSAVCDKADDATDWHHSSGWYGHPGTSWNLDIRDAVTVRQPEFRCALGHCGANIVVARRPRILGPVTKSRSHVPCVCVTASQSCAVPEIEWQRRPHHSGRLLPVPGPSMYGSKSASTMGIHAIGGAGIPFAVPADPFPASEFSDAAADAGLSRGVACVIRGEGAGHSRGLQ